MSTPAKPQDKEQDAMLETNIKAFIAAARYYLLGLLPPQQSTELAAIRTPRQH